MSKTITIDDDDYKLQTSLKLNGRDSFTKVILRHIYRPSDTCGELLELTENEPPPSVDTEVLNRVAEGRARRSGGRQFTGFGVPPSGGGTNASGITLKILNAIEYVNDSPAKAGTPNRGIAWRKVPPAFMKLESKMRTAAPQPDGH